MVPNGFGKRTVWGLATTALQVAPEEGRDSVFLPSIEKLLVNTIRYSVA